MRWLHRTAAATALVAAAGLLAAAADAATLDRFSSFWVLGDSLSDPGNLFAVTGGDQPPSPPYFQGRFSSGPVWAEAVAAAFRSRGRPAGNVAFGGAEARPDSDLTPDLPAQLGLFAAASAGRRGTRPLASLWFGANDLFTDAIGQPDLASVARRAADSVATGAFALSAFGVRDLVVFNLPDLGRVPSYALLQPELAADATRASRIFNARLDRRVDLLRRVGLDVTEIDIDALFGDLLEDPARFGVADTTLPCLFPSDAAAAAFGQPRLCSPQQAGARAFFDAVHPNGVIHGEIARIVLEALAPAQAGPASPGGADPAIPAPVPLPAPAALLVGALLGLAVVRRRRA